MKNSLNNLKIGIKGAGEMASAIAWRLYMANIKKIFMMEIPAPLAVRREVSFCEAVYKGKKSVEGVTAQLLKDASSIEKSWNEKKIALIIDPKWETINLLKPDVVIDAILAKKNLGTNIKEAPLVIALGPGFKAAKDAHFVIETNRGHDLGRILTEGRAAPNTGVPGNIAGYSIERVLRAPQDGVFIPLKEIGDIVKKHEIVGKVNEKSVKANVDGVIRGLIRGETIVKKGLKIGDVDPRKEKSYCYTISDKARAIAGSVLEAIMRRYNI